MSRMGYYNENEARSYPLQDRDVGLAVPDAAIVDFGCLMTPSAKFNPSEDVVWLYRLQHTSGNYIFKFRTDAEGLVGIELTFTVPDTSVEYSRFSAEYSPAGYPIWTGFLVVGDVTSLVAALAGGALTDTDQETLVEPATIVSLRDYTVTTVNTANEIRTLGEAPAGCSEWATDWPLGSYPSLGADDVLGYGPALVSDIDFTQGYNCQIEMRERDNQIVIGAGVGLGAGDACNEIPLFSSEVAPDDGLLLTGGPACSEIVQTINGINAVHFRIVAGPGIATEPGPTPNSIIVRPDFKTGGG